MKPWESYQSKEGPWSAYQSVEQEPEPEQPEQGFGEQMNEAIAGAPRAAGLAARYAAEGITAPVGMVADPIIGLVNMALPEKYQQAGFQETFGKGLDALGLPTPETPTERVTSDVGRLLTGTGAITGLAKQAIQKAPALASTAGQGIARTMAARPELQAASAAGAGTAGGVVRETGGDDLSQLLATIIGGVAAPVGMASAQKLAGLGKNVISRFGKVPDQKIDLIINTAAKDSGISMGDVSKSVQDSLRADMRKALKTGDVSPDVVRRLVDYRLTGATPTAGPLSRDPGTYTRQKNLAAQGATSSDPQLQRLSQIENENAKILVENLNKMGANTADDAYRASQKVIKSLGMKDSQAKSVIDEFYGAARGTEGRSAKLNPSTFTQRANDLLDEKMVGGQLPSGVRTKLNSIAKGETPLTVDVAEQLKTDIGNLQRASSDGQVRMSLGLVRQALDEAPLAGKQGQKAIDAFNAARNANRKYMGIVEKTPALAAIRDGVEPDKFMQTYVIGKGKDASLKSVMRLKQAIKDFPEAKEAIKNNMAQWLKSKALSGATDEVGKFSQSAYNKAIDAISVDKLRLFFSKYEIQQLKAIGRVASYEQARPVGAAVNESNTGAAVAALLERLSGNQLVRSVPFGSTAVGEPAKFISSRMQAKGLQDIPTAAKQVTKQKPNMYIPAALAPYLMSE